MRRETAAIINKFEEEISKINTVGQHYSLLLYHATEKLFYGIKKLGDDKLLNYLEWIDEGNIHCNKINSDSVNYLVVLMLVEYSHTDFLRHFLNDYTQVKPKSESEWKIVRWLQLIIQFFKSEKIEIDPVNENTLSEAFDKVSKTLGKVQNKENIGKSIIDKLTPELTVITQKIFSMKQPLKQVSSSDSALANTLSSPLSSMVIPAIPVSSSLPLPPPPPPPPPLPKPVQPLASVIKKNSKEEGNTANTDLSRQSLSSSFMRELSTVAKKFHNDRSKKGEIQIAKSEKNKAKAEDELPRIITERCAQRRGRMSYSSSDEESSFSENDWSESADSEIETGRDPSIFAKSLQTGSIINRSGFFVDPSSAANNHKDNLFKEVPNRLIVAS